MEKDKQKLSLQHSCDATHVLKWQKQAQRLAQAQAYGTQLHHTRLQKTPEFKSTIAVPIWKKEVPRSDQGNVEKEGKHPTLLKGDWNLISSTANLYFSTLGTGFFL